MGLTSFRVVETKSSTFLPRNGSTNVWAIRAGGWSGAPVDRPHGTARCSWRQRAHDRWRVSVLRLGRQPRRHLGHGCRERFGDILSARSPLDDAAPAGGVVILARTLSTNRAHTCAQTFPRKRFLVKSVENCQQGCGNPVESMTHVSHVRLMWVCKGGILAEIGDISGERCSG